MSVRAQLFSRTSPAGTPGSARRPTVRRVPTFWVLIAAIALVPSAAARATDTCANPITACPCAIRSAGDYTISGPGLVAAPPGNCIRITVPGVTLDLASATISSAPSTTADVGVRVLVGATGAVVRGTLNAPATVTGFAIGIEVDAAGVTLENLTAQANVIGIQLNGAAAYGSELAVHNSSRTGILIRGPHPGPYLTGVSVDSTLGFAGIELSGVRGAFLTNLTVSGSATYGIWLRASSRNVIANFSVSHNTSAGIYLGCFRSGGLLGSACTNYPPTPPSNGNILTSVGDPSSADGPSQPDQAYGVVIAAGNVGNRIIGIEGSGNGTGSFGLDALDGNHGCSTNLWAENQFTIASPGCVH
jgi:parallel beta-helix repeat protein